MRNRTVAARLAAGIAFFVITSASGHETGAKQPFTVKDSVAWVSVIPFASTTPVTVPTDGALFSPDHSHFVIHTRHGDTIRNAMVDQLLLFDTRSVDQYASAGARNKPPAPVSLAKVAVFKDHQLVSGIRWLSNVEVGYVAPDAKGTMQAFAVNIQTGETTQISASATNVAAYSVGKDVAVYDACVIPELHSENVKFVRQFSDALPSRGPDEDCVNTGALQVFVRRTGQSQAEPLRTAPMRLIEYRNRIWVDPSGTYGVMLLPAVNAPAHWAAYQVPEYDRWGYSAQWVRSDPTSLELINRDRYVLLNLRTREVRPLLDAPSGMVSFNLTPPEVFWPRGGKTVIVSNTFLPLSGTSGAERKRREQQPAIAEIDLTSDAVTPIVWERGRTSFEEELPSMIVGVEFQPEHDRLLVTEKPKGGEKLIRKTYRKHGSQSWRQERQEEGTSSSSQTLSVELRQSLNARPRLYIKRRQDEPAVELFDPNPQADQLTFSTTEVVHWTDSNGIEWQGGLLRPRGYVKGRRYPLVVQTHGFDPGKFLLDGPAYDGEGMTAMAAQALASAGFAVLQIEDNRKAVTGDEQEGPRVAAGWYAGIEKLIADGVVDQNNIGLIAFSRTGFHALYLMAAHPDLLGAVSLSDALQAGYASYLMVDNELFAAEIAKLTGGKPNVSNIGDWFARNPLYKLGHVRAPVRLEEMGAGVGFWETFTVLRDAGRPVEFVVYPNGSHVLQKPDERLVSQGGSVDWFSFWLRGYEDPNPDKRAQYTRWRKLRELRSTH